MSEDKLKTLNDIEYTPEFEDKKLSTVSESKELRQEAIKWVKEFKKGYCLTHEEYHSWNDDKECVMYRNEHKDCPSCKRNNKQLDFDKMIEWIKHFFNLTDEDLK